MATPSMKTRFTNNYDYVIPGTIIMYFCNNYASAVYLSENIRAVYITDSGAL